MPAIGRGDAVQRHRLGQRHDGRIDEPQITLGRKRATVYVTLGRMEEKGFLESRQEPLPPGAIGLPRRLYRPTGYALRVLAAWRDAERRFAGLPEPQEA